MKSFGHMSDPRLLQVFGLSLVLCWLIVPTADAALGRADKLEKWMDKELVPYLGDRLGQHPRLQGQPFSIVAMDGDDTQVEINNLTAWMREHIREQLQASSGVQLVWRPTIKPWNHPRSLTDLSCAANMDVHIQIGIDARYDDMSEKLKVSVKALDLKEGAWVAGFGMQYRERMTDTQARALDKTEPDEHLRGLKPLPFESNQADLLASYLATNLSCLLRQTDAGNLKLYAPAPVGAVPAFFATTLSIVDNYLGQFREVTLTSDPLEADIVLETEVHRIDPGTGLHQVWINARRQSDDVQLSGSQTQAYVRLSAADMANVSTVVGGAAAATSVTGAQPVSFSRTGDLINAVTVVTVASPGLCGTNNPWMLGQQAVGERDALSSGSCFALKVSMAQSADLVIFSQNNKGAMARLLPSNCDALGVGSASVQADQTLHLPQKNGQASVLTLDNQVGTERFYIVAADDPAARAALDKRTKDIPDVCSGTVSSRETLSGFEQTLNKLNQVTKGHLHWKKVQFKHQ